MTTNPLTTEAKLAAGSFWMAASGMKVKKKSVFMYLVLFKDTLTHPDTLHWLQDVQFDTLKRFLCLSSDG